MERFAVLLAMCLSLPPAFADTYDIVQVTPSYEGGAYTTVTAPGPPAPVLSLGSPLVLLDPADSVTCKYAMPLQTHAAGAAIYVQLYRNGAVPLGQGLPLYNSSGSIMSAMSDTVSDTPGYAGPLQYSVMLLSIVGSGHAPANFVGAGSLQCEEVHKNATP